MSKTTMHFKCLLCLDGFATDDIDTYCMHHRSVHGVDLAECTQHVLASAGGDGISVEFIEFVSKSPRRSVGTLRRERGIRRQAASA